MKKGQMSRFVAVWNVLIISLAWASFANLNKDLLDNSGISVVYNPIAQQSTNRLSLSMSYPSYGSIRYSSIQSQNTKHSSIKIHLIFSIESFNKPEKNVLYLTLKSSTGDSYHTIVDRPIVYLWYDMKFSHVERFFHPSTTESKHSSHYTSMMKAKRKIKSASTFLFQKDRSILMVESNPGNILHPHNQNIISEKQRQKIGKQIHRGQTEDHDAETMVQSELEGLLQFMRTQMQENLEFLLLFSRLNLTKFQQQVKSIKLLIHEKIKSMSVPKTENFIEFFKMINNHQQVIDSLFFSQPQQQQDKSVKQYRRKESKLKNAEESSKNGRKSQQNQANNSTIITSQNQQYFMRIKEEFYNDFQQKIRSFSADVFHAIRNGEGDSLSVALHQIDRNRRQYVSNFWQMAKMRLMNNTEMTYHLLSEIVGYMYVEVNKQYALFFRNQRLSLLSNFLSLLILNSYCFVIFRTLKQIREQSKQSTNNRMESSLKRFSGDKKEMLSDYSKIRTSIQSFFFGNWMISVSHNKQRISHFQNCTRHIIATASNPIFEKDPKWVEFSPLPSRQRVIMRDFESRSEQYVAQCSEVKRRLTCQQKLGGERRALDLVTVERQNIRETNEDSLLAESIRNIQLAQTELRSLRNNRIETAEEADLRCLFDIGERIFQNVDTIISQTRSNFENSELGQTNDQSHHSETNSCEVSAKSSDRTQQLPIINIQQTRQSYRSPVSQNTSLMRQSYGPQTSQDTPMMRQSYRPPASYDELRQSDRPQAVQDVQSRRQSYRSPVFQNTDLMRQSYRPQTSQDTPLMRQSYRPPASYDELRQSDRPHVSLDTPMMRQSYRLPDYYVIQLSCTLLREYRSVLRSVNHREEQSYQRPNRAIPDQASSQSEQSSNPEQSNEGSMSPIPESASSQSGQCNEGPMNSALSFVSHLEMNQNHLMMETYQNVGVIYAIWKGKNGQNQRTTSTAFLISPTKLVTCSHAIYSLESEQFCDEYFFIPGCRQYDKIKVEVFPLERQKVKSTISTVPRDERHRNEEFEFSVITLPKPVLLREYLEITAANDVKLSAKSEIALIGYGKPVLIYEEKTGIVNVQKAPRLLFHGKIGELIEKGSILHHKFPTQYGMGGSPILLNEGPNSGKVVGIHTAGAMYKDGSNSALYFSNKIFKNIEKLLERRPKTVNTPSDQRSRHSVS